MTDSATNQTTPDRQHTMERLQHTLDLLLREHARACERVNEIEADIAVIGRQLRDLGQADQ